MKELLPLILRNYEEVACVALICIGLGMLIFSRNLFKKIIGMDIMDSAAYLFLASQGYISGRAAPIVADGVQSVDKYINPIPAGLVLTGIVVSVSVSALALALAVRLYARYQTMDIDAIIAIAGKEEV